MRAALMLLAAASRKLGSVAPAIVAFGDSTAFGIAATTEAQKWIAIYAAARNMSYRNDGISGTVMQNRADSGGSPRASNGRSRYVSDLLGTKRRTEYVFLYGLNDLRYTAAPATMNLANFVTDYTEVIDGMIAAGVVASNITLCSPCWIPDVGYSTGSAGFTGSNRTIHEQYIAEIYKLAFNKGCKYGGVYERMRDNGSTTLVDADNIHPNNAGHAQIAIAVAAAAIPPTSVWPGTPVDSTAPTASSAVVENAAPTSLVITASEALNSSFTPATSAFAVGGHTVSAVNVSGSTITLTVDAFVNGEASRTVAYTQPGSNQLRDVAGNLMASFSGLSVTNNVSAGAGDPAVAATFSSTNAAWTTIGTERYSSNTGTTTFDAIAQLTGSTTVGTDAWVEMQFVNTTDAGGVIVLDPTAGLTAFTANLNRKYLCQLTNAGLVLYSANSAGTTTTTGYTFPSASANNRVRLHLATDGTVTIETSTDNGVTWTVRYTFAAVATAATRHYWKLYSSLQRDIYQPRQFGVALAATAPSRVGTPVAHYQGENAGPETITFTDLVAGNTVLVAMSTYKDESGATNEAPIVIDPLPTSSGWSFTPVGPLLSVGKDVGARVYAATAPTSGSATFTHSNAGNYKSMIGIQLQNVGSGIFDGSAVSNDVDGVSGVALPLALGATTFTHDLILGFYFWYESDRIQTVSAPWTTVAGWNGGENDRSQILIIEQSVTATGSYTPTITLGSPGQSAAGIGIAIKGKLL